MKRSLLGLYLLGCVGCWGAEVEIFYVQAARAEVRREPKTVGSVVALLSRGDSVTVVSKQDVWFEVRSAKYSGWVPRLFLSRYAPVGASELANLPAGASLEKASRRRPASFAVSAATRGLMISERARKGQERFPTDYEALARLEEREPPRGLLEKFRTSAKLSE